MSKTKDEIIQEMLAAIPDSYDKSEGSFIYDAVVGVATGLEEGYSELELVLEKAFADTAYGEWLDKIAGELGVYRKPAVKATTTLTITGTNGTVIPIGARFFVEDIFFTATESKTISGGTASILIECEEVGTKGNVPANSIINFAPIVGVASVTNPLAVKDGVEEETDGSLRERYYEKVKTPTTSGNAQHYINWCKEVPGVGDAKVFPLWNGNGTVKCVIINSNKRAADSNLITDVVNNIEAKRPIGAQVTVESAAEVPINISVDVVLKDGYDIPTIQSNLSIIITDYFKEIAFKTSTVSYAIIGSKILDCEGVLDYTNLTLNGGTTNVTVTSTQIAVEGTLDVI